MFSYYKMSSVRELGIFMSLIYSKITLFIGKDLTLLDKWNSSKRDVYVFRTKLTDWKEDRINFWNWVSTHTKKHPELYLIKGCVFLQLLASKMTEDLVQNLCQNTDYSPEGVWKTWIDTRNMGLFSATLFFKDILLPWAENNITQNEIEDFSALQVPIDDKNLYKEVPLHVLKDFVVPYSPPPQEVPVIQPPSKGKYTSNRSQAPPPPPSGLNIRNPGQQKQKPPPPSNRFAIRPLAQLKALFGR